MKKATMHQRILTRFDGIQVLRFVAALMVLVTHATIYTAERLAPNQPLWFVGSAGVDIFFVISGFVIVLASRARQGSGWVSWGSFLFKRALRVYPMYWLATFFNVAILLSIPSAVLHSRLDFSSLVSWLVLLPTYNSDGRIEPLVGPGWTLYFETFFYALFALSLALRRSPYVVLPPILIACATASFWRTPDWPPITVYFDPRVLEFLLGMIVAAGKDQLTRYPKVGLVLTLAGSLLMLLFGAIGGFPEFCVRSAAASMIVAGTVALEPWLSGRVPGPLLFLGAASYAIYLVHPLSAPIVPLLMSRFALHGAGLSVLGCIAVGLIVPSFVHRFVEVPILARGTAWLRAMGGNVQPNRGVPPEVVSDGNQARAHVRTDPNAS